MERKYISTGSATGFNYFLNGANNGYFTLYTYKIGPKLSAITAWGGGHNSSNSIRNMNEFIKYLTDLVKIDMGKVMLKMNN